MISPMLLSVALITGLVSLATAQIGNYVSIGCYHEPPNYRVFSSHYADDTMTVEECFSYCGGVTQYWGLEYGRECWCGNNIAAATIAPVQTDCNVPCAGNPAETCGAGNMLSLYNSSIPIPLPPAPGNPNPIGQFSFTGCFTEGINGFRTLQDATTADYVSMNNEMCAVFCAGYQYFGTEYGGECYCGNAILNGALAASQSECNMVCPGGALELCGAGNRLSLYTKGAVKASTSTSKTSTKTGSFTSSSTMPASTSTTLKTSTNSYSKSSSVSSTSSKPTSTSTTSVKSSISSSSMKPTSTSNSSFKSTSTSSVKSSSSSASSKATGSTSSVKSTSTISAKPSTTSSSKSSTSSKPTSTTSSVKSTGTSKSSTPTKPTSTSSSKSSTLTTFKTTTSTSKTSSSMETATSTR